MISKSPIYHSNGIKIYCSILLFVLFVVIPTSLFSQDLAFPTATGAGAYATGGRGKPIYTVTNLNNAGPGSFRQCLEDTKLTDGGIITFAVSGTINLTSQIYFYNQDNITIAGQTAPEGGITVANYRLRFQNVNNLIMRYIRLRPAYAAYPASEIDSFEIFQSSNYIIDHCSFAWGTDESVDSGIGNTYTWQRNIFAESKTGMIMGAESNVSYDLSFNNNLFYHCSHRFPNWSSDGRVDVINNVVWNWRSRMSVPGGGFEVNHINNYYVHYTSNPVPDIDVRGMLWYPNTTNFPTIYTNGNYVSDVLTDPNADNWFLWRFRFNPTGTIYSGAGNESPLTTDFKTLTPFPQLGREINIKSAVETLENITLNVGSNARLDELGYKFEEIDFVDNEYLTNVQNGNIVPYTQDNVLETQYHDDFLDSVSSTPINSHPNDYDTDNDGMPDAWEFNRFGNLNNNGQSDTDSTGYTDVEDYLNGVDSDSQDPQGNEVIITSQDEDDVLCEGESTTLTASGADSYEWNSGETSASLEIIPNVTTTYTVTGTHSDGSTTEAEITITVNQNPTANAGEDIETCLGSSVTLTATGGTSFLWNNGATTASIDVNPNITTTYTVEVFENTCSSTDEVIVTVNEIPVVNAGEDQTIFEGESATLTATGADSYVWSTGETTQSITVNPLLETSYFVTGTTNTCENTDTVTVFLLDDSVNANAGADTEICIGESTTLTAIGGTTYLWSTGETTASIEVSPIEITTYTVTVYSVSGNNSEEDSVIVTVNELPIANAGDDVEICSGNATTLTASGGSTYLWSTGETTETITVIPNATTIYTVEVFENNCSSTDQAQVTVNDLPETNAGNDVSIFDGESTILTASGADSYVWSTGETITSITVSPTSTTTYTVTGNTNGCEFEDSVIVTLISDDVTANAGDDIGICSGNVTTLTASGGTTYLWSTGETTASIEVSPTNTTTYTVTAYSFSGNNSAEDSVEVTVNELPVANAGDDVEICFGNVTTLTASGGSTYLWSTGEITETISVNPNVTTMYTVEVFENNCSSLDQVQVIINELPETNAGSNVSIIEGESTTLTATGADSYVWNTGEITQSITVSPTSSTTYTVTGSSNGCESSDDVIVSVGAEVVNANAGADVAICFGNVTTLIATGGSTYLWSTGETTASIIVSPNQTTTYTVTAFNEAQTASDDDSIIVTINELPETYAGNDVSITEGGSTTLTATGADSYVWSTGEITQSITVSPISSTTYLVTGNSNGCESSDNVIVSVETENINANAGADVAICNGESTLLTAAGGATYLWNTGETTQTIEVSPITTTTYIVTAFNTNGTESDDDSVTVTVNEIPIADAGNDVAICFGNSTTLSAFGGTTYLWNTGETTQNINVSPNNTTTYSVEVFTNNCSSTDDVIVSVNELPETNAGNDVTITEGDSTILVASGADSYIWSTGETTTSISVNPILTTTYTVTGVSNGCESIDDIIVIVEPFIYTASAGANQTICNGYETTLTASAGDSYLWSTGETTQSITVNPTNTQIYTVTVYEGDYQAEAEVEVGVNPNPNIVISNGDDVMILEGEFITLSASGANTYSWNNGATQPNIAVSPSITTTYEVTGFINNCEDTKAVIVNVLEIVQADAGEDLIICNEEVVTLTANGGDEYLWSNGETTQSIEVSPDVDTEYSVLVYNALDSDEDTIMVFVEECNTIEFPIESETFDFMIYQDPTTDILNVRIDGLQSVTAKGYSIYDLSGKIIYTEIFNQSEMQDQTQMTRELDVSAYSRGIYIAKLIYDDTSLIKKIPIR
nr:T9SS type A sorting domain-containing protein [uncultured Psychroserpens sp.]